MKKRVMGKLGISSSAFGLGCMRFNGPASGDSVIDEQKAVSLIRRAIDGGVTYLDTAYVYLDKTSEIVLGKALLDGYRERVTVATKMPAEAVHNREEMEALLEPSKYIGRCPQQVEAFVKKLQPLFADAEETKVEINLSRRQIKTI